MMDPRWTRWIVASLNTWFTAHINIPLFISGTDRRTETLHDYAELRIDGPAYNELSKGYWRVDVTVDVLVVSKMNDRNIYSLEDDIASVCSAFNGPIPIYEYRDAPATTLDCLVSNPGATVVTMFGQFRNDLRLRQATVESKYHTFLTT